MRRLALALALSLAALPLALPAAAQDTREARLAAASAYVAMTLEDMDIAAVVRTMYTPVLDQVRASGRTLSESQIAQIDALYQSTMAQPLTQILRQQDEIMADLFTLEQIEALAAFYASPVGRSVMTRLPQLIEAQQPQILDMVNREVPRMIPQLQAIIGG